MNCLSCNEINPEDSIFCGNCGNSLESELICPECGEANPQDSIYCAECGSLYKPSLEVQPQITIGEPENINRNTNRSQRSILIIGLIALTTVVVILILTLRPAEVDKVEAVREVPTEVIKEVEVVKEIPVENLNAGIDKEAETKEKHQRYSISSNPTHPLSQTYHDYEIGFSISYPEQWDLVEQNERDVPEWVIPDIELRNPLGGFIRIEGQKMEGVTLRNFTSDRITNDRNFVAETTEHIEKIPADLTTGIYSRSGEPAQILTAVIDPWVLSIVFINESSSKDEQSTTFMEIIESMEIR